MTATIDHTFNIKGSTLSLGALAALYSVACYPAGPFMAKLGIVLGSIVGGTYGVIHTFKFANALITGWKNKNMRAAMHGYFAPSKADLLHNIPLVASLGRAVSKVGGVTGLVGMFGGMIAGGIYAAHGATAFQLAAHVVTGVVLGGTIGAAAPIALACMAVGVAVPFLLSYVSPNMGMSLTNDVVKPLLSLPTLG
jgi:hypothetical protein